MQGEDVAVGPGRRVADLDPGRHLAPRRTAKPPDQGIELAAILVVEAPEIGQDAMPRLAGLVAIGLDDLQVTPPSAPVDAHEHAYIMPATGHYCNIYRKADV